MASFPWLQVSTSRSLLTMHQPTQSPEIHSQFPFIPVKSFRQHFQARASAVNGGQNPMMPSEKKNSISAILDIPGSIWRQTVRPLGDFGFGRRSIWEGGVGLFVVSGAILLALSLAWLRGFQLRSRFRKYQAIFEFSQACGISLGTPVRIRGVTIGTVIRVNSSLKGVDAVAEVEDEKIIIPRNSVVEVNQSGLLMETLIDITPREPLPAPTVGPLDSDCGKEGLIVCDREKIKGEQGVSLDALVGIFTRLGREMEDVGVSRGYALAEKVVNYMQEAQPLLEKIEAMAEDIQPLLSEVRGSALLKDVQTLTRSLAEATENLRAVRSSTALADNAEMLRQSINTLVLTLKNVEAISSDVLDLTSDDVTRRNLKLLIKSLSRLL